ncbi:MAG: hypothetical protein AB8B91_00180 [Rubripirellula sp.]
MTILLPFNDPYTSYYLMTMPTNSQQKEFFELSIDDVFMFEQSKYKKVNERQAARIDDPPLEITVLHTFYPESEVEVPTDSE